MRGAHAGAPEDAGASKAASFKQSSPFPQAAPRQLADAQLRANLRAATSTIRAKRDRLVRELDDFEELRQAAAAMKDDAQSRLDQLLVQLEEAVVGAGGHVHFAADAAAANDIVLQVARQAGARHIVKVKSMTSVETDLNAVLAGDGAEVTETDLAELIVQLGQDLPSHIVVPAIHRNRSEVGEIFRRRMGEVGVPAPTGMKDEPADLASAARTHLRRKFFAADMAISGANFVIAEDGAVVVVESEGNGRMCLTLAPVLVSIAGIDKVLPRFSDLEVFLQLLARSATGERMNPYTSIWRGVTPGDGPREFHLVLLDNGRSSALSDRVGRQALRCIRCAACLNVCPVYERVGGHAYGSVYPGPIGAVLTPQLNGVATDPVAASLPFASTLCGACYEVCPVRIDIPRLLVHLRAASVARARADGPNPESAVMAAAAAVMSSPATMARAEKIAGALAHVLFPRGRARFLPGPLARWTAARDAPLPARQPFREWWQASHPPVTALGPATPAPGASGRAAALELVRSLLQGARAGQRRAGQRRAGQRRAVGDVKGRGGSATPLPEAAGGRAAVLTAVRAALANAPFEAVTVPRAYRRAGQSGTTDAVALFVRRVSEYRATAVVCRPAQVAGKVHEALGRSGARKVVLPGDLPGDWSPEGAELDLRRDDGQLDGEQLEAFDACISGCSVAIAETGTIVLDAGPGQGRRVLSLVPDHLVVVVRADQVVGNVPDAVAVLGRARLQTWISGPSATSDIELSRVEGVHGPRRLDVVVVTGPPPSDG